MTRRFVSYILLFIGAIVALMPFVVTIFASLKTGPELVQGIFSLPEEAQWGNYKEAWV